MSVNKTGDPCETYRIDASGDFGACICGHPKAAHEEQIQNNAEKALKKLKQKNSSKDMSVNKTGKYFKSEGAEREWSTVVDISIPPPSFKPVLLLSPRSPLSKTPKQVIF